MSGTGIAPGFGGFAVTPDGQAQYMARHYNPYSFLQQPLAISDTSTAPAAEQSFATGGLVPLQAPGGLTAATRYMRLRGKPYRRGGYVRFNEGGGTGGDGNDGSGSGSEGNGTASGSGDGVGNGGMGGAAANGPDAGGNTGTSDSGFGSAGFGEGMNGLGGFSGPGMEAGGPSNANAGAAIGAGFGEPGFGPGTAPGFGEEPGLTATQALGLAGYGLGKAGLSAAAPGLGAVAGLAANALGIGPANMGLSPAAAFGNQVGSTLGGLAGTALGGPLGGMLGAALGGPLGATMAEHGETGSAPGAHGNAGTSDADSTNIATPTNADDLTSTIRRIQNALKSNSVQGLAAGGQVRGGGGGNHAFHRGSGLVHGTTDGRADALYTHVPPGGYVVPADVVSGLGQGNTLAGAKKLTQAMPPVAPPDGSPPGGSPTGFASGGAVPVRLSAGEFFVHPRHVAALGGSGRLDQMVQGVRQQNVRQVAAMPPPR
jgi:hypothetical protein